MSTQLFESGHETLTSFMRHTWALCADGDQRYTADKLTASGQAGLDPLSTRLELSWSFELKD